MHKSIRLVWWLIMMTGILTQAALADPWDTLSFTALANDTDSGTGMAKVQLRIANGAAAPFVGQLQWQVCDYFGTPLAKGQSAVTIEPGTAEKIVAEIRPEGGMYYKAMVTITSTGGSPATKTRYFQVSDLSGPRKSLRLCGNWEVAKLEKDAALTLPAQGKWETLYIPENPNNSALEASPAKLAWYRLTFFAPASMKGDVAQVRFAATSVFATAYLNGQKVGEGLIQGVPWQADVTKAIRYGQENELLVGLEGIDHRPNVYPKASMGNWGLYGDVTLETFPRQYVEHEQIITTTKDKRLKVITTMRNTAATPVTLTCEQVVMYNGKPVCNLGKRSVKIPAQSTASVTTAKRWAAAPLWWPHDPKLLTLVTTVRQGATVIDVQKERFGFRDVGIRGIDFTFNGERHTVRRGNIWPHQWGASDYNAVADFFIREIDKHGVNTTRTHIYVVPEWIIAMADETGMLIHYEATAWPDGNGVDYENPEFWQNYQRLLTSIAHDVCNNHPSVTFYSLWNELYNENVYVNKAIDAGEKMKALDPTRLIYMDGTYGAGGPIERLPLVALHYQWYPSSGLPNELDQDLTPGGSGELNTATAFHGGTEIKGGGETSKPARRWDRKRPFMLGEYLCRDLSTTMEALSGFFGDYPYILKGEFVPWNEGPEVTEARYRLIREVTDIYRRQGLAGLNPWFNLREGLMPSQALLKLDYYTNCWSGEETAFRFVVANEVLFKTALTVAWEAKTKDGTIVAQGTETGQYQAGEMRVATVKVNVPMVTDAAIPVDLTVTLLHKGQVVDTQAIPLTVCPKRATPATMVATGAIGLTEAQQTALAASGFATTAVADTAALNPTTTPVVFITGTDKAVLDQHGPALRQYADAGGKVVVLGLNHHTRALPISLETEKDMVTANYVRAPHHPLLAGVQDGTLRWWRPDNVMNTYRILKPNAGNVRVLIDCGSRYGLIWSTLMEIPSGKGSYLVCELPLLERREVEPAAQHLLANIQAWAKQPAQQLGEAAYLGQADDTLYANLASWGVQATLVTPDQALSAYRAVIVNVPSADLATWAAPLRDFAAQGGHVLAVAPTKEAIAAVTPLVGGQMTWSDLKLSRVARGIADPVMDGLSNRDLMWDRQTRGLWQGDSQQIAMLSYGTISMPGAIALTDPANMLKVPTGQGSIVVSTIRWDDPGLAKKIAMLQVSTLLTNMGVQLHPTLAHFDIATSTSYRPLDLSAVVNINALEGDWALLGMGNHTLRGVPYAIAGEVKMKSVAAPKNPESVTVPVNATAKSVYILHGSDTLAWYPEDSVIGKYILHYADGTQYEVEVRENDNIVRRSHQVKEAPNASLAWFAPGRAAVDVFTAMYTMEMVNPQPEKTITSLELKSVGKYVGPIVLGVTLGQ